jgi:S-phase kinase-associated protein 1
MSALIVRLVSSDGRAFEVDAEVIARRQDGTKAGYHSETVWGLLEGLGEEGTEAITVPLPNVRGDVLAKVVEFCGRKAELSHGASGAVAGVSDEVWELRYLGVENSALFELASAATYLDVQDLLKATSAQIARRIRGKTPEQIREIFGVDNDFTPEEEAELKRESDWLFD